MTWDTSAPDALVIAYSSSMTFNTLRPLSFMGTSTDRSSPTRNTLYFVVNITSLPSRSFHITWNTVSFVMTVACFVFLFSPTGQTVSFCSVVIYTFWKIVPFYFFTNLALNRLDINHNLRTLHDNLWCNTYIQRMHLSLLPHHKKSPRFIPKNVYKQIMYRIKSSK